MRKVILYIAMTLDGMIADKHDGFSFLEPYDTVESVKTSYEQLMRRTDTLLIGRRTYEVIQSMGVDWPYPNHLCYVYGKNVQQSKNITIIDTDISSHVRGLLEKEGQDIWLVGGGKLVHALLSQDLIDLMIITIIPIVLGQGIPLFLPLEHLRFFDLIDSKTDSGLIMLTYQKHNPDRL
jgi:dihydrofolate reductase